MMGPYHKAAHFIWPHRG